MAVENYASKANLSEIFTKVETKLSNRYTKAQTDSAIATAIAGVTQFEYAIVDEDHPLPAEGVKGTIYLVPNTDPSSSNNYNEMIWIVVDGTGHYETLGPAAIDTASFLVQGDVKVNTATLEKTADATGNGFTVDLSAATKASLAKADTAVQPDDIDEFLVAGDVKVDGTTITKTPDAEGNGFTLSSHSATTVTQGDGVSVTQSGSDYTVALNAASKASLAKADTALQPGDVEPLDSTDVAELKAIFTDD